MIKIKGYKDKHEYINPLTGKMSIVYLMDCMEAMSQFPEKYFDLAVVDPPYGIKEDGHRENNRSKLAKSKKYHKALWDQPPPNPEYFAYLFTISENQVIWGANNYPQHLKKSPCWLVWNKKNSGHFADCELAFISFNTAVRMFSYTWNGMLQKNMKEKEERIHPTQKPVALYSWIYSKYLPDGGKVIDTHLGSGSNRIAADKAGNIDFVAFEIDQEYFYSSVKRFDNYASQLKLFT
jgi:site-specific DNA-methyltransferase (adenine-specific)